MAAIQQRVNNLRGSEYFTYPLYIVIKVKILVIHYFVEEGQKGNFHLIFRAKL